ncbi:unnamed protein product [Pleuronectes platessa]|uniref:Small integral membrane protein 12 n=1 Tax=Pleuronectes platessa TaxID=8262 RepID=A0A9N7VY98_PLEPL|nr:unnamed protein product [Pleuronectes platessa]
MWPLVWTAMRTYAPYVTFPVALVVGAVGYHLEWFIRGTPKTRVDEKGIQELRDERKLQEQAGMDSTQLENGSGGEAEGENTFPPSQLRHSSSLTDTKILQVAFGPVQRLSRSGRIKNGVKYTIYVLYVIF